MVEGPPPRHRRRTHRAIAAQRPRRAHRSPNAPRRAARRRVRIPALSDGSQLRHAARRLAAAGRVRRELRRRLRGRRAVLARALEGYEMGYAAGAVVHYRLPDSVRGLAHQAFAYGRSHPRLYRDFARLGMPRSARAVLRRWAWLASHPLSVARGGAHVDCGCRGWRSGSAGSPAASRIASSTCDRDVRLRPRLGRPALSPGMGRVYVFGSINMDIVAFARRGRQRDRRRPRCERSTRARGGAGRADRRRRHCRRAVRDPAEDDAGGVREGRRRRGDDDPEPRAGCDGRGGPAGDQRHRRAQCLGARRAAGDAGPRGGPRRVGRSQRRCAADARRPGHPGDTGRGRRRGL